MEAQEQFKVGDIVHMVGTVADTDDVDESYPILVKFDDGQDRSFTKDGKFFLGKSATLSHYNPNEVKELKDEVERLRLLLNTEERTTIERFEKSLSEQSQSILTEAESIVNGSRNSDYGGTEGLERIAQVASILTNIDLTAMDLALIMVSLKLVRESFQHKRDNLVDACGYMELLNKLN